MKTENAEFESTETAQSAGMYRLRLYVTGTTSRSLRALSNVKRVCEKHLGSRYQLEVVDLYQQPALASGEQILAAPTLVKSKPLPLRKIIGDMSDEQRVLASLGLAGANA